jgi:hypothetical protein
MKCTTIRYTTLLAVGLGLLVAGCDDDGGKGQIRLFERGELLASPASLTFSAASPGSPQTLVVGALNVGDGPLGDLQFEIVPEGPFSLGVDAPAGGGGIEAGGSVALPIVYAPSDESADQAALHIRASGAEIVVPLTSVPPRRELQCQPDPLQVRVETADTPGVATLELLNIGTLPAEIVGAEVSLNNFAVALTPGSIEPGESLTADVTFTAIRPGREDAQVILELAAGGRVTCPVVGLWPVPAIDVSPARVDFGIAEPGVAVDKELRIRNVGDARLDVVTIGLDDESSPAFTLADTSAFSLNPDESAAVTVTCTLDDEPANGRVVITSNDPIVGALTIPLLCRRGVPHLVLTPGQIAFGNVEPGLSVTRRVTLANDGLEFLDIWSSNLVGDAAFTTTEIPERLAPGEELELTVTFAPTEVGSYEAALVLETSDPAAPVADVTLTGSGSASAPCAVRIAPNDIHFGSVATGRQRFRTATLRNTGGGTCVFRAASVAGVGYEISGAMPPGTTFEPGESIEVEVLFTAPAPSPFPSAATLRVEVIDPDDPNELVLCNLGIDCQGPDPDPLACIQPPACGIGLQAVVGTSGLQVVPPAVDFGLVTLGCASQARTVSVYDTGTSPMELTGLVLDDSPGCARFALRGVPTLPATVPPREPVGIQVVYTPTQVAVDTCNLLITTDATEGEPGAVVPLRGEGTTTDEQTDEFVQSTARAVDVLFLIDPSGSMGSERQNVADNLTRFLSTAELLESDFQIAVAHLGADDLVFQGNAYAMGQMLGDPAVLTPETPDVLAVFQERVLLEPGGGDEAGLAATHRALSAPLTDGPNQSFLRREADLEIVIVSDEEDQSAAPPAFYVDFVRSLKGFRADNVRVSVIVGADDNGVPGNCRSANGSADAGRRYGVVAQATGGAVGSICAADFGPYLEAVGSRAFGLRDTFALSRQAAQESVVVLVEGQEVQGWAYDAASNTITFGAEFIPEDGASISVSYLAFCFQ